MNNNSSSTTTTTTSTHQRSSMKSSLFSNNNGSRRSNSGGNNNNNNNNNNPTADRERSQQEVDDVIRENDAMLNALQSATGRMHEEANRLRNETKEHNQIVEQLLKGIGSASSSVRGTVAKLDGVMAKHGLSGTMVLSIGVFVAFVVLYYLMKYAWNYHRADPSVSVVPPMMNNNGIDNPK